MTRTNGIITAAVRELCQAHRKQERFIGDICREKYCSGGKLP